MSAIMTKLVWVRRQLFPAEFAQLITPLKRFSVLASVASYLPGTSQAVLILALVQASFPLSNNPRVGILEGLVLSPLIFTVYTLSREVI